MRSRRSGAALAGALLVAVLGLSACTAPAPGPSRTARVSVAAVDPAVVEAPTVARARLAGEQYDYDAALALLQPLVSPDAVRLAAQLRAARRAATPWPHDAAVSHLFFHSLVVDPARAFDGDADSAGYDDYMVTLREFETILRSLYARGFVLVSPHDLAAVDASSHRMRYRPILLPKGRTPIVLSQDDVDYYRYEQGDGLAADLTVRDGRVVSTYRDGRGRTLHGEYDVAPVVDDFVRQHPDFAYRGHKGVLALTGYEGVLGYRTSPSRDAGPHLAAARAQAVRVADALKAEGWEFASHSWGHIDDTTASVGVLQRDSARWDAEVRPITGPTDLYVYPFGADISGVAPYSGAKYATLERHGFRFFFGIDGSRPAWQQLHGDSLRQARIDVDGIRLRGGVSGGETVLRRFFDPRAVLDPARPRR